MKLLALAAAAGLVTAAAMTPTAAAADRWHHSHGWHHGSRWHWKTVCTTRWWHGHRHRVCRKVRVRW